MGQRVKASMTVEAALLYPVFFMIAILFAKLTVYRYLEVQNCAAAFYDAVFTERKTETSELLRLTDTAFDFFGK